MIISPKYKFIFIKTQKTAGSSIEKILLDKISNDKNLIFGGMPPENMPPINLDKNFEHSAVHVGKEIIEKHYPNEWKNYFKFTIERNSWDKVVSLYHWGLFLNTNPKRFSKGFDNFLFHKKSAYLHDWEKYTIDGNLTVDFVMQYDNLNNDLKTVMDILNLSYNNEISHTRLKGGYRKEKDYKKYYNDETREYVYNLYKKPIEYFKYSF